MVAQLLVVEAVLERRQKYILRRDHILFEVPFEALNLGDIDLPAAVVAYVVLDRHIYLLERLLLVPALAVVLVDDELHVFEALLLPLAHFAG